MEILFFISLAVGVWLGIRRANFKMEQRIELLNAKKTPRKRRVDVSEDAPEEMTQAELKAMGQWFS